MRNVYVTSATNSTSDIGKPYQYLNKTTWSRHIVVMNISHNAEERYALYLDTTVGCHKTNFLYISLNHKNQGIPTSAVPRDATNSNRVLLLDFSYLRLLLKVCFQLYSILNFFWDCFWYLLFIINSCMFFFMLPWYLCAVYLHLVIWKYACQNCVMEKQAYYTLIAVFPCWWSTFFMWVLEKYHFNFFSNFKFLNFQISTFNYKLSHF